MYISVPVTVKMAVKIFPLCIGGLRPQTLSLYAYENIAVFSHERKINSYQQKISDHTKTECC